MKKICMVLPSLHAGGMERVMAELVNHFSLKDYAEIHLVLLSKQDRFYQISDSVVIHEPHFDHHKSNLAQTLKLVAYLRTTIRSLQPHCVLSFGEFYNSFVLLALIGLHIRVYISDRSQPDKNLGFLHEKLRKLIYRKATGIIAQTRLARDVMFERVGHKNICVIGNPIKLLQVSIPGSRQNVILSVGRLVPSKQFDVLIRIFARINSGWSLSIIGDGPERPKLEQLIAELNLSKRVTLLPNQKDVAPFFARAKIFAFTSRSEGFPNALGEAMRAGLAVISYNFIAGAEDLIQDNRNGFLIELNNEKQFVERLEFLMADDSLIDRFAAAGSKWTQQFDIGVIGDKYYEFITHDSE